MLKYMNFLWATLFKRAFIYVIALVYAAVIIGLMYIFSLASARGQSFTLYPNSFVSFLAFLFAVIFMALVVIHVFKKQESEGTELLISAKPLSRKSIVGGKMLVVLQSLLGFSVLTFSIFLIGAAFDKAADVNQLLKFAAGIFLGQLIIGLLFTSIILLLGTTLKRTGIMVVSTLLPVGIFIVNMSAVPILGAIAPTGDALTSDAVYSQIVQNKNGTVEVKRLYNGDESSLKKNLNSKYRFLKYFDLWGQWAKGFNIIQQIPNDNQGIAGFYKTASVKAREATAQDFILIKGDDGQNYIYQDHDLAYVNQVPTNVYEAVKIWIAAHINNKPAPHSTMQSVLDNLTVKIEQASPVVKQYINNLRPGAMNPDHFSVVENMVLTNLFDPKIQGNWKDVTFSTAGLMSYNKYVSRHNIVVIEAVKPWLNAKVFAFIWGTVALVLVGWSYYVYLRRDFK